MSPSLPSGPWDASECRSIALVVNALSVQRRRAILSCLAGGGRNVGSLALAMDLDDPPVSQALNRFFRCGLVERCKFNKFVYYRIANRVVAAMANGMFHIVVDAPGDEHLALDIRISAASGR